MTNVFIAPFDFKTIFMNYFLGDQSLFVFAFLILISYACAKVGMSSKVYLIILFVSSLIFASYIGMGWYVLILTLAGFLMYKAFSRWAG